MVSLRGHRVLIFLALLDRVLLFLVQSVWEGMELSSELSHDEAPERAARADWPLRMAPVV